MYACIIYDIMCVWLKYYKSIKYIIIAVFLPERNTSRISYIYIIYVYAYLDVEFMRMIQIKYKKIVSKRFLDTMVVLQLRDNVVFKFRVAIIL